MVYDSPSMYLQSMLTVLHSWNSICGEQNH